MRKHRIQQCVVGQYPETPLVPDDYCTRLPKGPHRLGLPSPPSPRNRTDTMEYTEARKRLVDWLRQQLIGPASEDSLIGTSPLYRYPTGVLHPVELDVPSGIDPVASGGDSDSACLEDEEEEAPTETGDESGGRPLAQPVRRRRYVPPSSVGFSFFIRGVVRLSIAASAAVYKRTGERDEEGRFRSQEYERTDLRKHFMAWSQSGAPNGSLWEDRAGIDVRARPHQDGVILTVTLFNRQRLDAGPERAQERIAKSLFEARVECVVETGQLVEYPRVVPGLLTEEEQELELQYSDRSIHAVGHGAAVDWDAEPFESSNLHVNTRKIPAGSQASR